MTVNYWGVIWEIVKHPPGFLFRDEHLKQTEKGIFRLNGGQQGCKKKMIGVDSMMRKQIETIV